jgi:hypothetical protein
MKVKIAFKLSQEDSALALEVCKHANVDLNFMAKVAFIKYLDQIVKQAEEMLAKKKGNSV